jgi:hypothetical protein
VTDTRPRHDDNTANTPTQQESDQASLTWTPYHLKIPLEKSDLILIILKIFKITSINFQHWATSFYDFNARTGNLDDFTHVDPFLNEGNLSTIIVNLVPRVLFVWPRAEENPGKGCKNNPQFVDYFVTWYV